VLLQGCTAPSDCGPVARARARGGEKGAMGFSKLRGVRERRAPRVAAQVEADVDEGARRPGVVAWTRGRGQLL